MDNPFRQINLPLKEVPKELKTKVMSDIAMAKLIMELAELFSYNLSHVVSQTIKKRQIKNQN